MTLFDSYIAIAEYKAAWGDDWTYDQHLVPMDGQRHSNSVGYESYTIRRRYGEIRRPGDNDFETVSRLDLRGQWVRISMIPRDDHADYGTSGSADRETLGIGICMKIRQQGRRVGSGRADMGTQEYAVVGVRRLLELTQVNGAYWDIGGTATRLGRTPSFNVRYPDGTLRGNRTASKVGDSYLFGGTELWTCRDIAEYLLVRFVEQASGPSWALTGSALNPDGTGDDYTQALDRQERYVEQRVGDSVAAILDRAINPAFGLDYFIFDDESSDGFNIGAFPLLAADSTWEGEEVPVNPVSYGFDLDVLPSIEFTLESSEANLYDTVRCVGQPIQVALSATLAGGNDNAQNDTDKMWTAALEDAYFTAAGETDNTPEAQAQNDEYRASDRFRYVFSGFYLNPSTWDWQNGYAAPRCADDGTLEYQDETFAALKGQTLYRSTLRDLPMRVGLDYSEASPTDENVSGVPGELRPAFVLVKDPKTERWEYVDRLNADGGDSIPAHVDVLETEWGVLLDANPRHAVARSDWINEASPRPSKLNPKDESVKWRVSDYKDAVCTFAIAGDYNVEVADTVGSPSGFGLERVIMIPDAHLWLIAPQTIVDVDDTGSRKLTGSSTWKVTRDDRDILKTQMAGAKGRYLNNRNRATITWPQLAAVHTYTGVIIGEVVSGESATEVNAPQTSVVWDFQRRITRVMAGQATR